MMQYSNLMSNDISKGKLENRDLQLYLVTDRSWSQEDEFERNVKLALENGVTFLQLREKNSDYEFFLKEATKFRKITKQYNVPFVINDSISIALESDADGVHIGQSDMAVVEARKAIGLDRVLGVSVRTVEQAIKAEKEGADYLGVGAMFPTSTKGDTIAVDKNTLKEICQHVKIPVVGIGGISANNILQLKGTNISGVAVVSAILAQKNIKNSTQELRRLSESLTNKNLNPVLSIAGSDCSGGAGIQADIKTISAHNCYGMSVITALTAQNTTGVYGVENCAPEFVEKQIDCIFSDIKPDAIKIGMVSSKKIIESIINKLKLYKPNNIVIDPVMVSTSGNMLLDEDAITLLKKELLPLGTIITPNISEAELLGNVKINSTQDMIMAAKEISKFYKGYILVKGGHLENFANDLLFYNDNVLWFEGERIDNNNTHGTGCTLSSAIASNLALGYGITKSIEKSKKYITGALKDKLNLGEGNGPINHNYKSY